MVVKNEYQIESAQRKLKPVSESMDFFVVLFFCAQEYAQVLTSD